MAGHIKGHMVDLEASDITACQYLAAAVALEWNNLPKELQNAILQQASALGGLPATTGINEQIKSFIRRNQRKEGST